MGRRGGEGLWAASSSLHRCSWWGPNHSALCLGFCMWELRMVNLNE